MEAAGWGFTCTEQSPAAAQGFLCPPFLTQTDPGHMPRAEGMVRMESPEGGLWQKFGQNTLEMNISECPQSPEEQGV